MKCTSLKWPSMHYFIASMQILLISQPFGNCQREGYQLVATGSYMGHTWWVRKVEVHSDQQTRQRQLLGLTTSLHLWPSIGSIKKYGAPTGVAAETKQL